MSRTLSLTKPDDWHVHLRDGDKLPHTVAATAQHFARALVMPNLNPPLCTLHDIIAYRERVLSFCKHSAFTPFFSFYLNGTVLPEDLIAAKQYSYILGAKLYPLGVTTHAEQGVEVLSTLYPMLEIMQDHDLVLQLHGEMPQGDIFKREALFLTECLQPLLDNFPRLRIVLEHISTRAAVEFVANARHTLAATITPQHLLFNRNQLLSGGLKPHYYCLPILKSQEDQNALMEAASSGNPKFFAGTDSAPHAKQHKESSCGCAGTYTAPIALSLYAQSFEKAGKLEQLNAFLSEFGALFYHLSVSSKKIELINIPYTVPDSFPLGADEVIPLAAGLDLNWRVCDE